MTLEEKTKFIEESKNKNYLYVSPTCIRGGARLVGNYKQLELYENMDANTLKFAEQEIVNLISTANYEQSNINNCLKFKLIFCGDFDDLPKTGSFVDFIMNNNENMVAVYEYVKSAEQREFFVGFSQSKTIYNYDYIYLSLSTLIKEFENNNIKIEIDETVDRFAPAMYRDDSVTKFVISYYPKKIKSENGHQLKKARNEV